MEDLSQFLPRRHIVSLLVARFDGQQSLRDDFPSCEEHFFIEVVAGVKWVADIHSHIHQLDECDGLAETLGRLGSTAGCCYALGSERLCLWTRVETLSVNNPAKCSAF